MIENPINNLISNAAITILIVEDKSSNMLILEGCLASMKCNILLARSGKEALDLIVNNDLALVLLNVTISDMDGFQIAERMQESEKTKLIPVIFLASCRREYWSVFKGHDLAAVDCLSEPIDTVLLRSKVSGLIDLYKQKMLLKIQRKLLELKVNELLAFREDSSRLGNISNPSNFDRFPSLSWQSALWEQ